MLILEDLIMKINQSNLSMLDTISWIEVGTYSISYPNLIKINEIMNMSSIRFDSYNFSVYNIL